MAASAQVNDTITTSIAGDASAAGFERGDRPTEGGSLGIPQGSSGPLGAAPFGPGAGYREEALYLSTAAGVVATRGGRPREGGSARSFTRYQEKAPPRSQAGAAKSADSQVAKAWVRARTIQRTLALYVEVIMAARRAGAWSNAEKLSATEMTVLRGWEQQLAGCGSVGLIEVCSEGHRARCVTTCCSQAPCPRHQRRRSNEYLARADRLWHQLPNDQDHRWRLVTLNLKASGAGMFIDCQKAMNVRKNFFRWAKEHYGGDGRFAGWGAIELAREDNIHLHCVVYSGGERVERILTKARLAQASFESAADQAARAATREVGARDSVEKAAEALEKATTKKQQAKARARPERAVARAELAAEEAARLSQRADRRAKAAREAEREADLALWRTERSSGRGIPREAIQSWLPAQDCSVRGGPHPADDRCPDCRRLRRSGCAGPGCGERHPPYERTGRRCTGSWVVDIREIRPR